MLKHNLLDAQFRLYIERRQRDSSRNSNVHRTSLIENANLRRDQGRHQAENRRANRNRRSRMEEQLDLPQDGARDLNLRNSQMMRRSALVSWT